MKKFAVLLAVLVCFAAPIESFAAKQEYNRFKVKRIISKSKCFKCHAIERQKVGPAYINVSQKFGEDPDGHPIHHAVHPRAHRELGRPEHPLPAVIHRAAQRAVERAAADVGVRRLVDVESVPEITPLR